MANVRCPMCSKVNAPDAPVCAFCGARLKPLSAGETAPQTPGRPSEDDAPDWLSGLRGDEPSAPAGDQESAGAEANQDAELPDWLARIRGRARTESGAGLDDSGSAEDLFGGQEEARESGGLPGWLEQQPGGEAQEPASEGASDDDWLTRLQGPEAGSLGAAQPSDFSTLPDFSTSDRQDQGSQTPSFDMNERSEQPAADDWMSAFSSWNPDAEQGSEKAPAEPVSSSDDLSGFGLTGFLSNLETGEEKPPEPPPAVETGSGGFGLTGFLNTLETGGEQSTEPAKDEDASSGGLGLTGFFSSLESGDEQPSAPAFGSADDWNIPTADASDASSGEELPEWLSGAQPMETGSEPAVPTGTTGDLANWLASLEGEQPQETPAQQENTAASFGEETYNTADAEQLPGWLSSASQQGPAETSTEPQPEAESLPGWLSETPIEPPTSQPPAQTASIAEETPGWLSDLQQPVSGAEAPVPDWLSETAESPSESVGPEDVPSLNIPLEPASSTTGPAPFIDEDAPAWLRDFAAEGAADTSAEGAVVPPLLESDEHPQMQAETDQPFAVDLPDWLDEDAAKVGAAEGTIETGEPSEELARAELPSWVAAMRPVESAIPGGNAPQDTDQFVEKAGPLSGMRGVLPIPEHLIRYRKPPIYSVKLHTTEKQRNQSALLDSIIAQESQPLLIPPARSHAPHLIMRIVIALVLVAVVALPNLMQMLGMPFDSLSMPALQPVELEEMYNQINQGAQPGDEYTVLLAFDYEPGFSGEMRAAASPVIGHLMQQNARIVVVSTSPSGPALADRLLNDVSRTGAFGYSLSDRTVNLGFLPGGTISLLEFVRQPQFAAPATITGELAWEETFLSGVDRVQDFSQVIVLTDSAETGRAWVEQVWPQMREVPLFMIASAQAAPMLTPYLNAVGQPDSGQIDGMVSGLMGGAQYGWFGQIPNNPASDYWASYQIGIVLAIVLVLAGGLISGARRLLKRDDKEEA